MLVLSPLQVISLGHFGTLALLHHEVWWPSMCSFIFAYVNGCAICQQMKNLPAHPVPPPLPIPSDPQAFPFSSISMDFITSLPMSQGFDTIMVFIDHDLTKAIV